MAPTKANTTTTQTASPSPLTVVSSIDPTTALMVLLGIVFIGLNILMGRTRKGKTATARWASDGEKSHCRKIGKACIANPRFDSAAFYITEPIGSPTDPPENISTKTRVILPQICRGILVPGGPGSGKTADLIDPALRSALRQGFSVALYDFKFGSGGQSETMIPFAIEQGYEVRILAPGFDITQTCNLLDRLKDDQDLASAREIVAVIVQNTGEDGAKSDSFFDPAGIAVLSGAFLLAKSIALKEGDPDLANLLMVNQILNLPDLAKRLIVSRDRIEPWAYTAFGILTGSSGGEGKNPTEAGILATAIKTLTPMVLPNYLPAFCGKSSFPHFDPKDPLKVDGKKLIVFGVDKNNRASVLGLIAAAMQQIISYNLREGREQPLVISLDEFPTLSLKIILNWLNEERFNGASIIIGIQFLGQLVARYGQDWSKGFMAACATKVWFNPGEKDTADYISSSLGEEELQLDTSSKTFNAGKNSGDSRSISEQLHKKALIESHAVRQFPQGTCIIECPSVGNSKTIGLPYLHRFSFDKVQMDAFKASSRRKFQQICDVIRRNQQQQTAIDYSKKLKEYTAILERLLPLSGSPGAASGKPPSISGTQLTTMLTALGYDLSEFPIDPQGIYPIPAEAIAGGKVNLSKAQILQMLSANHQLTF